MHCKGVDDELQQTVVMVLRRLVATHSNHLDDISNGVQAFIDIDGYL